VKHHLFSYLHLAVLLLFGFLVDAWGGTSSAPAPLSGSPIPPEILAIMQKPRYSHATWALRVADLNSGTVIYNLNSDGLLLTGSVRKLFSVSVAINQLGADHRFKTPVFRRGDVDATGTLNGDLVLVAKGDLTMGGRDNGDGTIAFTDFDHVDANALGSAILTKPDPLAGLDKLAAQVRVAGIARVAGDVIVDARLFNQFRVPNQKLLITPIIVNDNLIDVTVIPTKPGQKALVQWRPHTAAFTVTSDAMTVAAGGKTDITLTPLGPHAGKVTGQIAVGFVPALPGVKTLVQTFRIDNPATPQDPAAFARTTFIEALERAGVTVRAPLVAPNPSDKLPPPNSYPANTQVAELVSAPYSQYTKLILKISHNLGANLSLMLFALTKGVRTIKGALNVERTTLIDQYGLGGDGFDFPTNGSGSPDSRAAPATVVKLLTFMSGQKTFLPYFDSLPILGEDGSLAEIGSESPAKGKVHAKTGTFLANGVLAQVLAGYIDARSARRLVYALYVNNVGQITSIPDVIDVFKDEGRISSIIYQLN
jgi:PBP4 family serine-type D-alanyl-D-alanine carboxypeptidase